jgi:hypothetical protein
MNAYGASLLAHLEQHGTVATELARATDVSLDQINKLRTPLAATTRAQTAAKIPAYYG